MNDLQLIKDKILKSKLKQEATKYHIRRGTVIKCSDNVYKTK